MVAGRVMSIRSFGKATFAHIQDQSDRIQIFLQQKQLGTDAYKFFKKNWILVILLGLLESPFFYKDR